MKEPDDDVKRLSTVGAVMGRRCGERASGNHVFFKVAIFDEDGLGSVSYDVSSLFGRAL